MTMIARTRSLAILRALDVRDFRLLWASEAISVLGDQFHFVALSWLVISLTGSGLALGTVLIAIGVPRALLLVPFGVLADRRSSRGLMLVAHVARGVIVGAIAALVLTGSASLPALAMLGALFGIADALYLPAQQAFLPRTLDGERLPSGNALLRGTMQMASIAGPPVAGVAIAITGTGTAFAVDAASFIGAAAVVSLMSRPGRPQRASAAPEPAITGPSPAPASDAPAPEPFLVAIVAGIRYVVADPALRMTMAVSFALNFALSGSTAVGMPWLADQRFNAGPGGLGVMAAAWAAGALAGTLLGGSTRLERQGRVILACVIVAGVMMAGVGLLPSLWGVVLALAVMGVAIGYTDVVVVSWLQARVDPSMTGRVMSLVMLMGFGITPLSLGVAGALIDVDANVLFVGSAALVVVTGLAAAVMRLDVLLDDTRAIPASLVRADEDTKLEGSASSIA